VQRNPYSKVPVLVDGEAVIYESAIIDEYLEEKFPHDRLMPADLVLRAKTRIWVDYMSTRLHAAASDITHNRETDKARERMRQHLTTLDKEMAGRKYLIGEYSLADVSYIPFYTRRERYGAVIDDTYPNLRRWGEDLIARPQVAPTI